MSEPVRFHLSVPNPHDHLIRVRMRFVCREGSPVVAMPSWTPGSYLMREYARHVQGLEARCDGQPCRAEKRDKSSWAIDAPAGAPVDVDYAVYAHELSVRTPHVDGTHAFVAGAGVFLYLEGELERSIELELTPPAGWRVFTTLAEVEGRLRTYRADDYDALVDRFIEMGPDHDAFAFDAAGVRHDVAIWGRGNYDKSRLGADMARVVSQNAALFDGLPYDRYLFAIHLADSGQGGLEHSDCAALLWQRHRFRNEDYEEFLRLVAHEHFHVWNVKRIRPVALGPFDYSSETYTRALWWMEGVTSYYDQLQVLRAGLIEPSRFLDWIAQKIERLEAVPGRRVSSIEEASFDAWIKLYRPTENSANSTVSYYLLGSLAVAALDLEIRRTTGGEQSFDAALLSLWARYRETGEGLPDEAFKDAVIRVGGQALRPFVERYVEGRDEIDWPRHFEAVGLLLGRNDKSARSTLGLVTRTEGDRVFVSTVLSDGPNAGRDLYAGDELVAVDGHQVKAESLSRVLDLLVEPGEVVVTLFRRGELVQTACSVVRHPGKPELVPNEHATAEQLARRREWLGGELG